MSGRMYRNSSVSSRVVMCWPSTSASAMGTIEAGLLDVQDLAAQREDRLRLGIAALYRGAAGRVALDDEDLGERRVFRRAVLQLAGHAARLEQALAARRLASLAGGDSSGRRLDRLADDVARLRGVSLEPVAELIAG